MTKLSSYLPHVLVAVALGGAGCTDEAPTHELELEAYDAKTDSLITHTLNVTITETHEFRPREWARSTMMTWESKVEVTGHTEDTVSMTTTELVFEPPPSAFESDGGGWLAWLRKTGTGWLGIGTTTSMMVWSRAAGSDDEWESVEFPPLIGTPGRARFMTTIAHYASGEARAYALVPPTSSCAFVYDWDSTDPLNYNVSARVPELVPGREYRIWVVPIYNFCEWSQATYDFEVEVGRGDGDWLE